MVDKVTVSINDHNPDVSENAGNHGSPCKGYDGGSNGSGIVDARTGGIPQPDTVNEEALDGGHPLPAEDIAAQLEAARLEAKENFDRVLRISAEFENYKKRSQREMDEFRKYSNDALIKQLLPIVDCLERAIQTAQNVSETQPEWIKGLEITHKETLKVLTGFGLAPFESLQKPFDPAYHQAMMQEESNSVPPGTVIKQYQQGYLLHDRLIRPAMVVVSKAGAQPEIKQS